MFGLELLNPNFSVVTELKGIYAVLEAMNYFPIPVHTDKSSLAFWNSIATAMSNISDRLYSLVTPVQIFRAETRHAT